MPLIAELPPIRFVAHEFPQADVFGDTGKSLTKIADLATRHWRDRVEHILSESENEEPPDYQSIPLQVVKSVKVRYQFAGKLKPIPYDWDD
ncbi:MAG TPA: hypothetical protein VMM56_13495 [Planctomycetaceae bacterium]|nr:hypothetical protein [Planctomycetaceae bacterium]